MALSGEQWVIAYNDHEATIVAVGGGVRSYSYRGRPIVMSYGDEELAPGWSGHMLAPWPNRVRDGKYRYDGTDYQLPVNEIETNTSLHGFVAWAEWNAVDVTETSVTLECRLPARLGYPWTLHLRTRWSIGPGGLRAAHTVSNPGHKTAPFGFGTHSYLIPGSLERIDEATLHVPAAKKLKLDKQSIPVGSGEADFGDPTVLKDLVIDDCYGELKRGSDGKAEVRLADPVSGQAVTVWMDESFPWVHIYTADGLDGDRKRGSVAIEPTTCPPNALATGEDLVELSPSEAWFGVWGIRPE
ncbi:aldose 1-epimerase family protein [Glycomyces tritici]|uniref:Aldose 1-epimerase family protein n=1 Tax=Glycomyces tritici TaxID=2665176 RepID=A0ABT7YYS2_9ACTN|nr:aldose 1-epimerase family protein [Glycomyces tritici]MDN3243790.1 aldose 1-epimerase family protein [Glycomyces tritici]